MNHYHDHERQQRTVGNSDRPPRPSEILADLHRCVRKQAWLLFELQCHPDLHGDEEATRRLSDLSLNKPAEQWEELRALLHKIGVHVHPYAQLPKHTSPIQSFSGSMTELKWRNLTPAGLKALTSKHKTNNQQERKD